MKKQFFRVKQLADQTFSRADKTEVLSDDLQEADRKVEYIRIACQNTGKKLTSSLPGQGQDPEKRLKKIPEHLLGVTMQDCGSSEEDCLLGNVLFNCGRVEQDLASAVLDHEFKVEQLVVTPLQQILDKDVPNILKHKRNLAKLTLDMDSARTRYQTALKHSASTGTSRVDSIKGELEDAELKVEQCRDMLASEMFQLVSRESELAQTIVQYAKLQQKYHATALAHLDEMIPVLEGSIIDSSHKPVYGISLEEHLQVTDRKIALPIELCVCALIELGMDEEGLFRVAGGASKLRRMKMSLDARCLTLQAALEYRDPHVIAGALKSYLRELPEPLMTHALYEDWMSAGRVQLSNDARLQALWQVVHKMPVANHDNLRYLVKFLSALSRNHDVNKMTPQNIAIVIAPNLIWSPSDETNTIGMNMNTTNMYSFIVDNLVSFADWFFPGELDFFQTFSKEAASLVNGMSVSQDGASGSLAVRGHVRSSSGEGQLMSLGGEGTDMKRTQSSSSLSDHSSPPHGSPKPATRRKNKPAPVPPANSSSARDPPPPFTASADKQAPVSSADKHAPSSAEKQLLASFADKPDKPPRPAVAPMVSTLPRPSKKHIDQFDARPSISHPVEPPATEKYQKLSSGSIGFEHFSSVNAAVRRSLELDPSTNVSHQRVLVCSGEKVPPDVHRSEEVVQQAGMEASQTPAIATAGINTTTVTVTSGNIGKVSVVTESQQKAHAGSNASGTGRVTVAPEGPQQKTYCNFSGTSTLERKPQQRPVPVAAPRSIVNISPGGGAAGGEVAVGAARPNAEPCPRETELSERPMLERTHMYSVDKQQVSIIQVGGEREKAGESVLQRSPSVGGRPLSMSLPEKCQSVDKPERPPKPEGVPGSGEKEQRQSGHSRTLSEGNIFDIDVDKPVLRHSSGPGSGNPPSSPRVPHRPPRPQPPPPPPPVRPRADSSAESTDL